MFSHLDIKILYYFDKNTKTKINCWNIIMYSLNNGYSFWDLLKITFNSVTKITIIFKDNFMWGLDDAKVICKNVKINEMSMYQQNKQIN